MTGTEGFVLGVDLGTSHTVAMLRHPDGRTRPLLFDGRPLLPSAVYLDTTGRLHVGADALRLGHAEPGRLEPNPKRHVDDGTVQLGGADVPVADLFAALLGAIAREAVATTGFLPPAILTYPAAWGAARRSVLTEALGKAGWPAGTSLVPEPVAAARYFAEVLRRPVPTGSSIAVFDFGGGTLDVAVVRADGPGTFSVTASGGADDLGGLDIDAALVEHLGKSLAGAEPAAWQQLTEPATLAQWRARRRFWEDVRGAKEMLSRSSFAPVPVPAVEHAVHLTRDELEASADPLIRRGVAEAASVIAAADLKPADLAGLFLVGGSSRIPLVARLLHSELGIAPTVLEQPELPVAEGAIITADQPAALRYATGTAAAATPTPTSPTKHDSPPPSTDTRADAPSPVSPAGPATSPAGPAAAPAGAAFASATPASSAPGSAGPPSTPQPSATPPSPRSHSGSQPSTQPASTQPASAQPASTQPASAQHASAQPASTQRPSAQHEEETDERLRSAPVDPWATGEAAAWHTVAGPPIMAPSSPSMSPHTPSWPSSGPPSSGPPSSGPPSSSPASSSPASSSPASTGTPSSRTPSSGTPSAGPPSSGTPAGASSTGAPSGALGPPHQRGWTPPAPPAAAGTTGRRRRAYLIIAAAVTVVVAAGAVLTWVFWPRYGALDYHALSDPRRIQPIVPVTTDFSDAEIYRDRAYFASVDSTAGGIIGVVAVKLNSSKPLWSSKDGGTAYRWKSMIALPVGLALFTDFDSNNGYQRRMAVLGAADGKLLWQRTLAEEDEVFFAGDTAVVADRKGKQLLGLKLSDGSQRWSLREPESSSSGRSKVLTVTTPTDLGGPATVFGRPFEPDLADDPRIVQIGADKSARVIDANTGKILTDRQNVAQPTDEVVAHNGRLIVLQPSDQRILSYQLDKLGEPKVVYTTQTADAQLKDVTPCGDDRVCFDEEVGYDGKTASVIALDVTGDADHVAWRYKLANVETIVPVGEAVVAGTTSNDTTLIDGSGKQIWTRPGEAARLDGGNLLEFSKPLSKSPDDPALSGRHLGDEAVPLGAFSDIRSDTCAWNTSTVACVAEKDFVLQRFAG
ncbi:hypothetical protein GCM10010172_27660 [Paractinoplanes ferrugineus]|uniref:Pyrrolo-quinoline quinone repeat domain-containing protein n=1 Tax=Paractinoplanes ferrugineus TaxID=113564 RepID=A0A919IUA3_9ACTN|nr:Hsp70 family protein [Actinoplanes ferrugineus]GIE08324.1 hypothetical protein Afe05nite_01640 [Actinoplanes ferrugineus]